MTTAIATQAAGRLMHWGTLPEANDAFLAVILKTAGLEALATLRDYDDLAALLAAANDEADFAGYARQTLTGVTVTVADASNSQSLDANNPAWSPTAAQAIGMLVIVYDSDTTGGGNASIVPVFFDDAIAMTTPTSGTLTYDIASGGFATATAS